MAAAIERQVGIETIPHLTTRDYTVLGLEALLLGAHAEGVRNVLAVTGDPPEVGDYPGSKGIYEVDAIGLTRLITHLNTGESYTGKPIDAPTSFFVGVALNPTADDLGLEVDRFWQKVEAGARFAMTQILFDLASPRRAALSPRRLLADPRPRRALSAFDLPARAAAAQRGAGHRRPGHPSGCAPRRRLRARLRSGSHMHERCSTSSAPGSTASTSRRRSGGRSPRSTCCATDPLLSYCMRPAQMRGFAPTWGGENRWLCVCGAARRARLRAPCRDGRLLASARTRAPRRRRRRLGEVAHAPRPANGYVSRPRPRRRARHDPVAARTRTGLRREAGIYLHRAAQMVARGERVVLAVYGQPWQAPVDDRQRGFYCTFLRHVVTRIPIRDVVVWNEANSPQFWPASAGPAAYEALLARCWDRLRTVQPGST